MRTGTCWSIENNLEMRFYPVLLLFMYNEAMDPRQLSRHVRFEADEMYWTPGQR
jgi:hypothetical protein